MKVLRLARKKYANTLSGMSVAIKGARWNSPGIQMIYTAENRSLAMAEAAVHLTVATLPDDYLMLTIIVPDQLERSTISEALLPGDWNRFPYSAATQAIGDTFILENKYCLLRVPSVVTRGDFNILINPHHIDFNQILC